MIMHSNRGILCALLCALTLISLGAAPLRAQDAQERASAAEAYDRGTSAYLAQNFAAAARWFETAHRLAPAAPALIQAVRAHLRADHGLRAATLALRLHLLYPDDQAAQEAAAPVLETAAENYVRVEASCDDCTLELDGTLLETPAFFVDPGGDHALIAHFATGEREVTVRGAAGDELSPAFEAPPPSDANDGTGHVRVPLGPAVDAPEPASGLPVGVFITSLALTAGAGAALVWSGLDTNSDADAYEASIAAGDFATAERQLAKGRDEELRTNILIGITAGLGVTTALLAAFTKWGGDSGENADEASGPSITGASLAPLPGGGAVGVQGHF